MYIMIFPKSGEPYYYQKMIGKHAVKGSKYNKNATLVPQNEVKGITTLLREFVECGTFYDYGNIDDLLKSF